ncbi:MAG: MoaD/ThiS family protein [Gammaproteobacteria bacterium]|nr:MoaD/ThiS family protein [Gammaproteobacteria bacterium]
MIRVKFFGALREQLGCDGLELADVSLADTQAVRGALIAARPEWQPQLSDERLWVAVNQTMAQWSTTLADGDEVAIFPPVTGG